MYSNFQFCEKKLSKFRIKRVDSWYGYTEAFKTAHARKKCPCLALADNGQTGNVLSNSYYIGKAIFVIQNGVWDHVIQAQCLWVASLAMWYKEKSSARKL